MAIPPAAYPQDAASIAGRILAAWKDGPAESFEAELRRAALVSADCQDDNSLEREKMDVLDGVVQSLQERHDRPDAGRAALRLLEHLAE